MDGYWARTGYRTELTRGRPRWYGPDSYMKELHGGRVVESAVFLLTPMPGSPQALQPPTRLYVQVRTGVSVFSRYRDRSGRMREALPRGFWGEATSFTTSCPTQCLPQASLP